MGGRGKRNDNINFEQFFYESLVERTVGADLYPYGHSLDSVNIHGENIWEQTSFRLPEGNVFEYNCQRFDLIYVSAGSGRYLAELTIVHNAVCRQQIMSIKLFKVEESAIDN